jgi:hypothetical protein
MAVTTAAALTAGSIAASAAGAGMSFKQAAEESRRSKDAEAAANRAMDSAMSTADQNFYDKLSIKKTPYQMEQEASLAVSANAMEAAKESERGASAAAGRLAMVSNNQARNTSSRMTNDLQEIERLQAGEDARLENEKRRIMLAESEGAGIASNEAANNSMSAVASGVGGLSSAIQTGMDYVPLYNESGSPAESANVDLNAPVPSYGTDLLAGGVQGPIGPNLPTPGVTPNNSAINTRLGLMDTLTKTGMYTPESLMGKSDEELRILAGVI